MSQNSPQWTQVVLLLTVEDGAGVKHTDTWQLLSNKRLTGYSQGQRADICLTRESIIIMAPLRPDIVNQYIASSLTKFDYCALAVMATD
jgi:hypothetical protein